MLKILLTATLLLAATATSVEVALVTYCAPSNRGITNVLGFVAFFTVAALIPQLAWLLMVWSETARKLPAAAFSMFSLGVLINGMFLLGLHVNSESPDEWWPLIVLMIPAVHIQFLVMAYLTICGVQLLIALDKIERGE